MADDHFYLKVSQALTGCQLVEQQLKLYISEAFELAKKCIGGKMPFKFSGSDCENWSLGRLIENFDKLNNNPLLKNELIKFKKERDFLSHRAITSCLTPDMNLSSREITKMDARLDSIEKEAYRLWQAIHEEANIFRGYLYFDDETNSQ